ncbi:MAG: D-alanine--D-alanine ligase [Kofleriaceae bacterium]|jgi:D-alanine-D-alanine ligase|nr:D-alanine--D-alanine ligase [Kofleriaceae bacterium]MBP6836060.1 D-alanine--D-alanine ligase [Kofleriaceae bacterium]MBP9205860.1 D-alanine--D-alanine ligase [Kofleriaceae bacterium]
MKQRKIGVLMGGLSSEREVSLRSGEAVLAALLDRGYHAVAVYVDRDLDMVLRQERIELAFIALHGRLGEDGCVQGLLETLGIPYTGSDVLASALAMNKAKAKELFRLHNVPTPAYYVLAADEPEPLVVHGDFGFPCVVKPVREGSSVGVEICRDEAEFVGAVERAGCFDHELLVERFCAGQEVSVAILGDRAIGAVEIAPIGAKAGFYDYGAKYTRGATEYFVPPRMSPERYRGVLAQALRAHRALGCAGATRVDLIVSDTGNEVILEVNTVPGLTQTSLLPKIAHAAGIAFDELCEVMLLGAGLASQRRRGERRDQRRSFLGEERRAAPAPDHH